MGRRMLNKLRSRKGASLTFALLAFLVCAVVGAVLLASASAAAGRLSGLAQSDQRYYAVTSAAQLFCDSLDGQSFTIEQTHTVKEKTTTQYIIDAGGGFNPYGDPVTEVVNPSPTDPYKPYGLKMKAPYDLADEPPEEDDELTAITDGTDLKSKSFLTEAALYYVFGETSENYASYDDDIFVGKTFEGSDFEGSHSRSFPHEWKMTLDVGGQDSLKVDVTAIMSDNGDIEFKFTNQTTISDKSVFSVIVELKASVKQSKVEGTPINIGGGSSGGEGDSIITTWMTTRTDTTKTTVITWRVAEIKKVSA